MTTEASSSMPVSKPRIRRQTSMPTPSGPRPRSRSTASSPMKRSSTTSIADSLHLEVPAHLTRGNLVASLLGSIVEIEEDLKVLEESEAEDSDDSGDEEAGSETGDEAKQQTSLEDFINQARAYINHVKAYELPDLGFRPSAKLAEMRQAVGDPCAALNLRDVDISSYILTITKKLERVHENLTALVSASVVTASPKSGEMPLPSPDAASASAGPSSAPYFSSLRPALPRRLTLTRLYASVPSMPPSPLPALKAFFALEAIRLSDRLPPALLRRPSFANLPDLDEMVSRAKENIEHFAGEAKLNLEQFAGGAKVGIENLAGEARKEFLQLLDEAEKMKFALQEGAKRLLRYDELPQDWQRPHILSGYRFIPIERWNELLISFFQWHNETVNVWSHALGAALLIYGIFCVHPQTPQAQSDNAVDGGVTLVFLLTAVACLTCSATWHLFSGCGTSRVFNNCACLDYVGISLLITSSVVSAIWFGFRCEPALAQIYITFSLATGVAGVIFPWQEWFNQAKHKGSRIFFFLAMCASAVLPQAHMALKYGLMETISFYSPLALSVVAYLSGLTLYAFNIPECITSGGITDTIAHSHQFWHGFILLAILAHWRATVKMYEAGVDGFSCMAH